MLKRTFVVSGLLLVTGCTQPGETTAVGAAAGGVLGAGLGAIIGSQTGSAGAGVAIGATAGATGGALLGNAIQAQNETFDSQSEAIARQRALLEANQREIQALKGLPQDAKLSGARGRYSNYSFPKTYQPPTVRARMGTVPSQYRAPITSSSRMTSSKLEESYLPKRAAEPVSRRPQTTRREISPPPVARKTTEWRAVELPSASSRAVAPAAVVVPSKPKSSRPEPAFSSQSPSSAKVSGGVTERDLALPAKVEQPEVKSESAPAVEVARVAAAPERYDVVEKGGDDKIPVVSEEVGGIVVEDSGTTSATVKSSSAIAPSTKQAPIDRSNGAAALSAAPVSEECKKAEVEGQKATASAEVSDKLFHYRRALRLCPTSATLHNSLGEVYRSLNRTVDAEYEFREALKLDPNLTAARKNLDQN